MGDNRPYPALDDVKQRLITAVCQLYRHDQELLAVDANERSLTHKLAEHLQDEFPGWHVDCEYNRHGHEPKRLPVSSPCVHADDTEAMTVFPDVIVHRRQTDQNLFVIEVKKTHGQADTRDIEKLEGFTVGGDYRYQYGVFLRLDEDGVSKAALYQDGAENADWTDDLRRALLDLGYGG